MEFIPYIVIVVVVSGLIMVGTNIIYDLAVVIVPIIAIVMVFVGIIVGLVVALKNTLSVYKTVYMKKGE